MTELVTVTTAPVPWSGVSARPTDRTAALEQLPGRPGHDPFERLAAAFLLGYTGSTARAYLIDLQAWRQHCTDVGVHPFDARRHHVDLWIRLLTITPLTRTGRPMAPASIARRLSAVSAFYDHGIGVDNADLASIGIAPGQVSPEAKAMGLTAVDGTTEVKAKSISTVVHPNAASGCNSFVCIYVGGSGLTVTSWQTKGVTGGGQFTYSIWWTSYNHILTSGNGVYAPASGTVWSNLTSVAFPLHYANNTQLCNTWYEIPGKPCIVVKG